MKTKRTATMVAILLLSVLAQTASAFYNPSPGRWLNRDPIEEPGFILLTTGEYIDGDGGPNLYGFVRNDGLNYYDLNGLVIETGWDIFNVGAGVVSLFCNVKEGNLVGAFVDAGGLGYDLLATAVPGLPAGGGTTIRTVRLTRAGATLVRNMYRGAEAAKDAKSLVRWGIREGKDAGHHIVAITASKASPARARLKKLGIDINDLNNGVALPTQMHQSLHTDAYYKMVNDAAQNWKTKQQAIDGLAKVAEDLLKQSGKLK